MKYFSNPIAKRNLLYSENANNGQALTQAGAAFKKAEWLSDAIDFNGHSSDELIKMREEATAEGNVFLFLKISKLLNEDSFPDKLLLSCAQNAESQKKHRYALLAFEKLGLEKEIERIKDLVSDDLDIVREKEQSAAEIYIPNTSDEIDFTED